MSISTSNHNQENNTITIEVECIRGNGKENLTSTTTQGGSRINITGKMTFCSKMLIEGEDVSSDLLGCRVTTMFDREVGEQVLSKCLEVYCDRELSGDVNPTVMLRIEVERINLSMNSALAMGVRGVEVVENVNSQMNLLSFKKRAEEIKRNTRESSEERMRPILREKKVEEKKTPLSTHALETLRSVVKRSSMNVPY